MFPRTPLERAVEGLAMTTDVATKSDLASLKGELKADIAQLETRLTWRLLGGVAVLLGLAVSIIKLI